MSLLTPPHTSHRADKEKENKFPEPPVAGPSTRSVVWATKDIIHSLGTPIKHVSISSKHRPSTSKSILKAQPENYLLELPAVIKKRETTPEPSDPLVDLHYLDHPVDQILSNTGDDEESLAQLTEGYNVLAARLRSCVTEATDADASWPIFQPLRKNRQAFVNAVVRDVKRALIDPLSYNTQNGQEVMPKLPRHALPSPATSPMKKRGGLSEDQVKYARDLCTTCHSVIKLLATVLCLPAVYNVFDENQLGDILTAALAIPLADDLPTPNARKTCALAIWLIQVQRLPADVLRPAASRIAYALRRGLDGELGKEGKKGSANDGLKAIHDLCVYLPSVFVPAFTQLLPSLLANLLAPTLALRTQACHALGGFAIASTTLPVTAVHTKIASIVAAYLTTATPSPTKGAKSPVKVTDAAIVRTLRTTLGNVEPVHVASGPVWGLSVCVSFLVLLRSRLSTDAKVNRILANLLGLGFNHKKSSIRGLTCAVWRPMAWTYFQPPLPPQDDEESDIDEDSYLQQKQARMMHCKVMLMVTDCQAGVSTIAALLGDESSVGDEPLKLSLDILQDMTSKAGHTCKDAVEALQQMVSGVELSEPWNMKLLLPSKLFSANPGLLTTDFKSLATAVRPIFDQVAMAHDIRSLTREEMTKDWVLKGIMMAWRTALGCLEMEDSAELPENLNEIWLNLLTANVGSLQENADEDATSSFACSAIKYIIHVIEDPKLNLMPRKPTTPAAAANEGAPDSDDTIPEYKGNNICTNGELRMRVVHRMWTTMCVVFPHATLRECAEGLLHNLMKNETTLVRGTEATVVSADDDAIDQARTAWVGLCIDVLRMCDPDAMRVLWACEEDMAAAVAAGRHYPHWCPYWTGAVWKICAEKWTEVDGSWEGGVVLLGVPFTDRHTWGLGSEDYALWEQLLQHTTNKSLDLGTDSSVVLDSVASFVSSFQTPGASPASSLRLVDLLLSNIEAAEIRELPMNIMELTSETMRAMYPPEPRVRHFAMWVVRSLSTVIEHCPKEFSLQLLQTLQDGLCLWLADQSNEWTENEFTYDIVTLYQHIVLKVQDLPESLATLEAAAPILDSIFHHRTPTAAVESFTEFWKLIYSQVAPPAEGWTGSIRHCLGAVGILPVEKSEEQKLDITTTSPLAPAFVVQPSSPRTPVSASFSTPPTAILRREALARVQSPQRPHKVFGSFPIVPSTPPSPVNHRRTNNSVRRTPLSAIQPCNTPSKRRRLMTDDERSADDKENTATVMNIPSVTERISGLGLANSKKRRLEDDEDEEAVHQEAEEEEPVLWSTKRLKGQMKAKAKPVAKKARIPSPAPSVSSNESEDERSVAVALMSLPFPSVEEEDKAEVEAEMVAPRRTRGNGLRALARLEAKRVEPAVKADREIARSLDYTSTTPVIRKIDLGKMPLRKSTSIPEALLKSVNTSSNQGKRKRAASDTGYHHDSDLYDLSPSDPPLAAIRIGPPRHAKKSQYTFPTSDSDLEPVQTASSDDDPHYGQVTPHHLISPILPRKLGSFSTRLAMSARKYAPIVSQELFRDDIPGSDDTVCSSGSSGSDSDSPTKEFLTRQLQRTASAESISRLALSSRAA